MLRMLLCLLVLGFSSSVFADYTWDNGSGTRFFDTLSNWTDTVTGADPTSWVGSTNVNINDTAGLGGNVIVDSYVNATTGRFRFGHLANSNATMDITGGTIFNNNYNYFGYAAGAVATVNQSGGQFITSKSLSLGSGGGQMTWNLSGGVVDVKGAWNYYAYVGVDATSNARMNISGTGLLKGNLLSIGNLGLINITGGAMKFTGTVDTTTMTGSDYSTALNNLIAAGKIINSTGKGLRVTYNPTEAIQFQNSAYTVVGVTTVEAIPEPATLILLGFGSLLLRKKR